MNDQTLISEAVDDFHRQININFKPDGASTDFYKRDAPHYHLYDVEPLLTLARAGERAGQTMFEYRAEHGATLRSGVDFVTPFATGIKTHTEFVNSTAPFDRKRAQNDISKDNLVIATLLVLHVGIRDGRKLLGIRDLPHLLAAVKQRIRAAGISGLIN